MRCAHKHMPHLGCRVAHQVDIIERVVRQGRLSRAAVVVAVVAVACTGQRQRAMVVARKGAGDPSTWVPGGDTRVGARDAWEEAGTREGAVNGGCQWQLSMAAVNGGSGGMYRAVATRRCGQGQVAEEKAVWIVDGACVLHPLHMAALSWSAMGHIPCDTCVTCHWRRCWWQSLNL